jgi:pimeloyl-ACP methyl ester carboxylesterase
MNGFNKTKMKCSFIFLFVFGITFLTFYKSGKSNEPVRQKIYFKESEREYFILKPQDFDPEKKYWLIVVVHGGGGNGSTFFMTEAVRAEADKQGLQTIVIAPSFSNTDFLASRFPELGEGEFLKQVLKNVYGKFNLHKKILLTGYSRGGQFTHRFALLNPEYVKACAPFAAGTWTTPDGRLLIDSYGEVGNLETFLLSENISNDIPERLHNLFQPRVAEVAGIKAKIESKKIPFLVMCGTLDTRYEIAREFAGSLKSGGYKVQTQWPQTPHGEKEKYKKEFAKYSQKAVEFFQDVTYRSNYDE